MVKLILSRHISPELDTKVFVDVQKIYVEYGGVERGPYTTRRDAGVPKLKVDGNSESRWLKRRREVVQQAASKRPRTKLEVAEEALNEDVDDTKDAAKL